MTLTSYDMERIRDAKKIIDSDLYRYHPIADIAAEAHVSRTLLKKGFKELFEMSVYQYWKELRLDKGRRLMEETDKPVKEISHLLGYRYANNFCYAFKKRFGKSPQDWRKIPGNDHT
jgi:AraC-like DNA-binding protein